MKREHLEIRLQTALAAARESGRHALSYFQDPALAVESKADASPVTIADREAEQILRRSLSAAFPRDAILGEEFPEQPGDSGYRWILDPIDGTKSFIRGVPLFGTLVGLEFETRSVLGVIIIPALDECVYAAAGLGAWTTRGQEPPRPARVSGCARLSESLVCTSDVAGFAARGRPDVFDRLLAESRLTRTWGDCYGYLMVATGRAEVMIDPALNVWDAAALQPILEEAGGTFTDWAGQPTIHAGEGLATNGRVLEEVLRITR